jgi:hypothetical protein
MKQKMSNPNYLCRMQSGLQLPLYLAIFLIAIFTNNPCYTQGQEPETKKEITTNDKSEISFKKENSILQKKLELAESKLVLLEKNINLKKTDEYQNKDNDFLIYEIQVIKAVRDQFKKGTETLNESLEIADIKIKKQEKEIMDQKARIQEYEITQAKLEESLFYYIVTMNNNVVFYGAGGKYQILKNKNYIKAKKEMNSKNFSSAAALLQKVIQTHPNSDMAYEDLSRALYRSGLVKKSKVPFAQYLKIKIYNGIK